MTEKEDVWRRKLSLIHKRERSPRFVGTGKENTSNNNNEILCVNKSTAANLISESLGLIDSAMLSFSASKMNKAIAANNLEKLDHAEYTKEGRSDYRNLSNSRVSSNNDKSKYQKDYSVIINDDINSAGLFNSEVFDNDDDVNLETPSKRIETNTSMINQHNVDIDLANNLSTDNISHTDLDFYSPSRKIMMAPKALNFGDSVILSREHDLSQTINTQHRVTSPATQMNELKSDNDDSDGKQNAWNNLFSPERIAWKPLTIRSPPPSRLSSQSKALRTPNNHQSKTPLTVSPTRRRGDSDFSKQLDLASSTSSPSLSPARSISSTTSSSNHTSGGGSSGGSSKRRSSVSPSSTSRTLSQQHRQRHTNSPLSHTAPGSYTNKHTISKSKEREKGQPYDMSELILTNPSMHSSSSSLRASYRYDRTRTGPTITITTATSSSSSSSCKNQEEVIPSHLARPRSAPPATSNPASPASATTDSIPPVILDPPSKTTPRTARNRSASTTSVTPTSSPRIVNRHQQQEHQKHSQSSNYIPEYSNGHRNEKQKSPQELSDNHHLITANNNNTFLMIDVSGLDEWKEASVPLSSKRYYYNRRTRQSSWKLPSNAIYYLCPATPPDNLPSHLIAIYSDSTIPTNKTHHHHHHHLPLLDDNDNASTSMTTKMYRIFVPRQDELESTKLTSPHRSISKVNNKPMNFDESDDTSKPLSHTTSNLQYVPTTTTTTTTTNNNNITSITTNNDNTYKDKDKEEVLVFRRQPSLRTFPLLNDISEVNTHHSLREAETGRGRGSTIVDDDDTDIGVVEQSEKDSEVPYYNNSQYPLASHAISNTVPTTTTSHQDKDANSGLSRGDIIVITPIINDIDDNTVIYREEDKQTAAVAVAMTSGGRGQESNSPCDTLPLSLYCPFCGTCCSDLNLQNHLSKVCQVAQRLSSESRGCIFSALLTGMKYFLVPSTASATASSTAMTTSTTTANPQWHNVNHDQKEFPSPSALDATILDRDRDRDRREYSPDMASSYRGTQSILPLTMEPVHSQTTAFPANVPKALSLHATTSTTSTTGMAPAYEECIHCKRRFAIGKLQPHARVCLDVFGPNRRQPFDGRRHRLQGTPMEHYPGNKDTINTNSIPPQTPRTMRQTTGATSATKTMTTPASRSNLPTYTTPSSGTNKTSPPVPITTSSTLTTSALGYMTPVVSTYSKNNTGGRIPSSSKRSSSAPASGRGRRSTSTVSK